VLERVELFCLTELPAGVMSFQEYETEKLYYAIPGIAFSSAIFSSFVPLVT